MDAMGRQRLDASDGVDHPMNCGVLLQCQWEFQDPKLEVLYHIRPYFAGIFPYIGLT